MLETTDTQILEWLESMHTLHYSVDAWYVVDGYEAHVMRDGNEVVSFHGETLRDAYIGLMDWRFDISTRTIKKVERPNA